MSTSRAAIIEEFDDDTDLPLPTHAPLPNTGARGPLLQQIDSSDDDEGQAQPGPAYAQRQQEQLTSASGKPIKQVTDITPYKKWTCVYPIYIDAKRPYDTGQRRVARAKSLWWPLSKDIASACEHLGLGALHEVGKTHPRDWENPGRVRVQWKKEGKPVNPRIKTKKQLLESICLILQHVKPENIPKPPYNTTPIPSTTAATSTPTTPATPATPKGKQPASAKSRAPTATAAPAPALPKTNQALPIPPEPHPPLSSRVSPYSPALSAGVLIETVKAGMAAQAQEAATAAPISPAAAAAAKGKRKVVRVRQ